MEGEYSQPSTARASSGLLQSGSPEYQKLALQGYEQRTQPQYKQALSTLKQRYASRGLQDSGLSGLAELGLEQSRMADLGQFQQAGALRGADLAEENRRRVENRGWQVEDRNAASAELRAKMDAANARANQEQASQLLGMGAGAVGTYFGGPVGGAAAQKATTSALSSQMDEYAPAQQELTDDELNQLMALYGG